VVDAPLLALVPIALALAAVTGRRALAVRRLFGVTAFLAAVGGAVGYFVGLYAPILTLAGSIQ
jgi:hypothetical protein